jgi:hypothetical protein
MKKHEELSENLTIISQCRRERISWKQIAISFNCSYCYIKKWKKEINFQEPFMNPTNDEVIEEIKQFLSTHPYQGERMLQGYLRSNKCWYITRSLLRSTMKAVDPDGNLRRLRYRIKRRVYHGVAPGYIWHLDTHHKLGKFGLVTFGVVDGFTHQILVLKCCTDNKSLTLLDALLESKMVKERSLPIFIRGDGGLENAAIAKLTNSVNGVRHFLSGRSVHNQRIERMWRDVYTNVIGYYKTALENIIEYYDVELNPYNVWIIQRIFLEGINEELRLFQNNWNGHAMRTEKANLTPNGKELLNRNISKYSPERSVVMNQNVKRVIRELRQTGSYQGKKTAVSACPFRYESEKALFECNKPVVSFSDPEEVKATKLLIAFDLCNNILNLSAQN